MWSCARAFVRSRDCWAMTFDAPVFRADHAAGAEACDDYERDQPRPWMVEAFAGQTYAPLYPMFGGQP